MEQNWYSHYRPEDETYQTNACHVKSVAELAERYCGIAFLKKAVWLAGLHHDDGKNTERWQRYFLASVHGEGGYGEDREDHSTLGGLVIGQYEPQSRFAEMLQTAIYMHHGLSDCISVADDSSLLVRRQEKYGAEDVRAAVQTAERLFPDVEMAARCREAKRDVNRLAREIKNFAEKGKNEYETFHFYSGLCERMLISCLMDADWRDTADFMDGETTAVEMTQEEIQKIWETGIQNLEARLQRFTADDKLSAGRKRISDCCRDAAYAHDRLYRLTVPTGAGKTLAGLRFALYHAREHHRRRIFYIAPYKSILEQNAEEIRKTLGMPEVVLEHHSDVIQEDEKQLWRYERLIENWDGAPVVVTTAVQFLNTLFQAKRSNLRRFHSLCDSVILFDEAQALPVKVTELFNLAVNFLTRLCNTTVVLCTATQPLFSHIAKNRMFPGRELAETVENPESVFRRVEYHDCLPECGNGLSAEQAAAFVREQAKRYEQILLIVNTKSCAKAIYENLAQQGEGGLYHLSTWMCARHRSDRLREIREKLQAGERVICISTQLVEAGVDFSFQCVIRSLAGLDNLIQAAGRCNRNARLEMGHVFLIQMSQEAEHTDSIPDIKKAQDAMRRFLGRYRQNAEEFASRMDSAQAVRAYYCYYFYDRQDEMCYNIKVEGIKTSLVKLLSSNPDFAGNHTERKIRQAFRTAGEKFSVIEEKEETAVIAPYGEAAEMVELLQKEHEPKRKRVILRRLQQYAVPLSKAALGRMGNNAVYKTEEEGVLVLHDRYYSTDTGVMEEPSAMPFLGL